MELTAYYDAQRALIGAALLEPKITGELVQAVREEDFNVPELRTLYAALRALFLTGRPVDPVLLVAETSPAFEPTVREILRDTPTAANWRAYAKVLRESAALRAMQDIGAQLAEAVDAADARRILASAEPLMLDRPGIKTQQIGELLADFLRRMEDKTPPNYLRWGIRQLDERLYAERGDLIILGGLPSSGKTLLATQFAMHMARSGLRVGIFSLETSDAKLYDRMVAQTEGINFGRIKRNQMVLDDYKTASTAIQTAEHIHLDVIRAGGFGVADVQAVAMARRYDVIVIDYVQLLQAKGNTRVEQVTNISLALHTMAQRAGIAVIALSQLSRPEKGQQRSRTPSMSDLRESGQLEQDADAIMILAAQPGGDRVLSIVKNKEGERGAIELVFDAAHLRMAPLVSKSDTAADHDDEDDWPRMQAWPRTAEGGGELP